MPVLSEILKGDNMSKKKKNRSWIQHQRDSDRHYSEWFKRVHGSAYEGSPEEREDLEELNRLSRRPV